MVDFTEDYSNLQKGVIDAKTSAPQYIEIAKLYEVAKYYTVFHGIGSLYAFTINSDVYNDMPTDVQDALNEEMSATAKDLSEQYVNKFYELEPVLKDLVWNTTSCLPQNVISGKSWPILGLWRH